MNTEIKQYYDYYLKTKSISKTSKKFNKCTKYLAKWFKESDLNYPVKSHLTSLKLNEDYFENIDTQNKAYILGYIYADGCITNTMRTKTVRRCMLSFNLILKDREILDFILKELNCKSKIRISKPTKFISPTNEKEYIRKPQIKSSINRTKIVDDLIKLGLCHRKTYAELSIPNISKDLIPHFLRGFYDGDGGLAGKTVRFTSKTSGMLKSICDFLDVSYDRIRYTSRKCFVLSLQLEKSKEFLDIIYKNHNFCLQRKFRQYGLVKSCELLGNSEIDKCLNN